VGGDGETGERHQAEQTDCFQGDCLAAGVGSRNHEHRVVLAHFDRQRHGFITQQGMTGVNQL